MTTLEKNGCRRCWYGCVTVGDSPCPCECHSLNTKTGKKWDSLRSIPVYVSGELQKMNNYEREVAGLRAGASSGKSFTTKTGDWEKLFDEEDFMLGTTMDGDTQYLDVPKVKQFIRETHQQLLNEVIEMCEGMKQDDDLCDFNNGYHRAMKDLKSLLENKRDDYGGTQN